MPLGRPLIAFAHRGGAGESIENSDVAIARTAARTHFRLETDVRLSADGRIVLSHDASLARAWGVDLTVESTPWSRLAKVRGPGGERLVTLDEVFSDYPDLRLNIEPKDDAVVVPLVRAIGRSGREESVIVSSFAASRIRRVRALAPHIPTGATPGEVARLFFGVPTPRWRCVALQLPPRWKGIPLVTPRLIAAAHRAGLEVHVWTINSAAEMVALRDLGVDGIMTDYPDLLAEIMCE